MQMLGAFGAKVCSSAPWRRICQSTASCLPASLGCLLLPLYLSNRQPNITQYMCPGQAADQTHLPLTGLVTLTFMNGRNITTKLDSSLTSSGDLESGAAMSYRRSFPVQLFASKQGGACPKGAIILRLLARTPITDLSAAGHGANKLSRITSLSSPNLFAKHRSLPNGGIWARINDCRLCTIILTCLITL
jgi:hypothetical protein